MINQVVLVGNLARDPELRTATSGNSVCTFTLAVSSRMKDENGKYIPCFITCICFAKRAETVAQSVKKGSLVGVQGYLNQRKYKRKDGSMASVIECICDGVTFLEAKDARKGGYDEIPPFDDAPAPAETEDSRNLDSLSLPDEDLPF